MTFISPILAWIDVETTGLDPETDLLLEVALVLTDDRFERIDSMSSLIWNPPGSVAAAIADMDKDVVAMHWDSGLLQRLGDADPGAATRGKVDRRMLRMIEKATPPRSPLPWLAGNSITLDRGFLQKNLNATFRALSYRSLDMTSVRGYAEAIGLDLPERERRAHRALADLHASILEARALRDLMAPRLADTGTLSEVML